jgi:hypothetical protein
VREAEVEIRKVDRDEDVGPLCFGLGDERPVTDSPLKSATRSAPAARSRSLPKPVIVPAGSIARSSRARASAYKSPEGSPQEIITRNSVSASKGKEPAG